MRVRFYGVRGSIATPGPSTVRYGGNTVCVEVQLDDGTRIVLDAGTGIRECGKQIEQDGYTGTIHLFITHPHWDHLIGLPFFGPMYTKGRRILFHPLTAAGHARMGNPIMFDGEHFPVRFRDLPAEIERTDAACEHRIGSARITAIALNHPGGANGFRSPARAACRPGAWTRPARRGRAPQHPIVGEGLLDRTSVASASSSGSPGGAIATDAPAALGCAADRKRRRTAPLDRGSRALNLASS